MVRFRISLRSFLLATTIAGVLLGTLGKRVYDHWQRRRTTTQQHQIAEKLTAAGCQIEMFNGDVTEVRLGSSTNGSKAMVVIKDARHLERLLGYCPLRDNDIEMLREHSNIRQLLIYGPGITNHSLGVIGELHSIQRLDVGGSSITDDGLLHLGEMDQLESIFLCYSPISGRGLTHLARLPNLHYVSLNGSAHTDDGLAAVAELKNVEVLDLTATRINGSGLLHLRGLPKLKGLTLAENSLTHGEGLDELDQIETLVLDHSRFEPGFLTHIADMKNLRFLGLLRAHVNDDMLSELKDARQIEELRLTNTPITDAGLVHLRELKQLKTLTLTFTAVTAAGAGDLSHHLPNTTIVYARGDHFGPDPK